MRTRRRLFSAALVGLVGFSAAGEIGPARGDPCGVDLAQLRARAIEHAGLAPTPALRRRARLAGLVPEVTVRGSRGVSWHDPWDGPRPADDEIARRDSFDVRLTWRLDRLIFDPVEPAVAAGERTVARARVELEDEVTTRYFRWRRADLDAREVDGPRERLAADEAFASLDGITGGWLAAHLGCRP